MNAERLFSVCHVNRVIYDVMLMVCFGNKQLSDWPTVDTGDDKVDPLREGRVIEVLQKQGLAHCCVTPWSFGQDGQDESEKLINPAGSNLNTQGQFLIADNAGYGNIKVFDTSGKFVYSFTVLNGEYSLTSVYVYDIASDRSDNTYLMVKLETPTFRNGWDDVSVEYGVVVFDHTAVLHHRFAIKVGDSGFQWSTSSPSLTVNDNNKVLVLGKRRILSGYCQSVVDVFETDGQFVRTFGEGILKNASDITAGNEGQVMVVDGEDHVFVHVFSEQREHLLKEKLSKFEVGGILDPIKLHFTRQVNMSSSLV